MSASREFQAPGRDAGLVLLRVLSAGAAVTGLTVTGAFAGWLARDLATDARREQAARVMPPPVTQLAGIERVVVVLEADGKRRATRPPAAQPPAAPSPSLRAPEQPVEPAATSSGSDAP